MNKHFHKISKNFFFGNTPGKRIRLKPLDSLNELLMKIKERKKIIFHIDAGLILRDFYRQKNKQKYKAF